MEKGSEQLAHQRPQQEMDALGDLQKCLPTVPLGLREFLAKLMQAISAIFASHRSQIDDLRKEVAGLKKQVAELSDSQKSPEARPTEDEVVSQIRQLADIANQQDAAAVVNQPRKGEDPEASAPALVRTPSGPSGDDRGAAALPDEPDLEWSGSQCHPGGTLIL